MKAPARSFSGSVGSRPVALWHEVGRRTRDDTTATVFHTTPIPVIRPPRGATDARVTCRVCREPVRVRVVDVATARRLQICGDVLGRGQYVLAGMMVCTVAVTLASLGFRLGSGFPALLAGLVIILPLMLSVLWLAEWAERRRDGVTILGRDTSTHTIGAGRSPVTTRMF